MKKYLLGLGMFLLGIVLWGPATLLVSTGIMSSPDGGVAPFGASFLGWLVFALGIFLSWKGRGMMKTGAIWAEVGSISSSLSGTGAIVIGLGLVVGVSFKLGMVQYTWGPLVVAPVLLGIVLIVASRRFRPQL